ncbi:alpha/beta hydrolase [Emcibacteraceae bacterium]|nr:alpha/beta hydrolase [Emcibacteraceae bacterium]
MPRTAHYIDCQFGQLHYYQQGENEKNVPLICFHISPYSGRYYEKFQQKISSDRIVICPDTPGYGGSSALANPASIEEITKAMVELVNSLGYEQVDLLGFHTGILIAAELTNILPDKIRKLILPGIPLVPKDKRSAFRKNYETPRPYFEDKGFLANKWNEGLESEKEGWNNERKIEMFAEVMRAGLKSNWGFMAVFDYDIENSLSLIEKPVLIPIPDEMLAASSRAAAGLFKNAEVIEMPHIQADLFENCPAEFIDQIRVFLT